MKLATFLRELGQPVAYYPQLAQVTGGVVANLFLCQMYYWQGKQSDPNGWIYKTQAEIESETGLSRREQETARQQLLQRGLLKERYKGLPRRLEFWLDEDELETRWCFFLEYKGEKPLVKDNKLVPKRLSSSTPKSPERSQPPSHQLSPASLPQQEPSFRAQLDLQECPIPPINNAQNRQSIMTDSAIIDCTNPPDKNAQNVQAVMAETDMQVCRFRASNIYTEITTENTCRDYNTYPPYPPQPGSEQPGECVKPRAVEKLSDEELANNHGCEAQTQTKTCRLESTFLAGDNCSAATQSNSNRYQRSQPESPKNLDGSDRLPWDTAKRGVFDPEFEKHMARSLMQYPAYQNLMFGELMTKIRKHISAGRYDLKRRDELLIEWEAMTSGTGVEDGAERLSAKAAARRAKIRSALLS